MERFYFRDGVRIADFEAQLRTANVDVERIRAVFTEHELFRQDHVDFVGFAEIRVADTLLVFLPKTAGPEELRSASRIATTPGLVATSRLTFEAVVKYAQDSGRVRDGSDYVDRRTARQAIARFATARMLVADWRLHGVLTSQRVEHRRGEYNRVDWPRTISRTLPVLDRGVPLYLDVINRRSVFDVAAPLPQIHRHCTIQALALCGWLEEDAEAVCADVNEGVASLPESDTDVWLKLLSQALESEFSDDRIRTIRLLVSFLENRSDDEAALISGTNAFHTIWQRMCGVVLGDEFQSTFAHRMPQPRFLAGDGTRLRDPLYSHIRQIPDIVYDDPQGDCLVVADAKYYDPDRTFPGWPDIGKQMLYATSIAAMEPERVVANAFVLLQSRYGGDPRYIQLRLPNGANVASVPTVLCVYWSIEEAMRAYVHPRRRDRGRFRESVRQGTDVVGVAPHAAAQ